MGSKGGACFTLCPPPAPTPTPVDNRWRSASDLAAATVSVARHTADTTAHVELSTDEAGARARGDAKEGMEGDGRGSSHGEDGHQERRLKGTSGDRTEDPRCATGGEGG